MPTGSIPGRNGSAAHELGDLDLREEPVLDHLEAVQVGVLGGVVLTGVMEASGHGERRRLLESAALALAPGGVLVIHCLAPSSWDAVDGPPEADLVQARPYRPTTWPHLLADVGLDASVTPGPDDRDYLVVGRRATALRSPACIHARPAAHSVDLPPRYSTIGSPM